MIAQHRSESNEWYTPAPYVDAARAVLGGQIDLDPASNAIANEIVRAKIFFSMEDNGLEKEWFGSVFLNPPYGKTNGQSNAAIWSERLISAYKSLEIVRAILLVNAVPGTKWFQPLWRYPICFTDHRIRFYNADGQQNSPTHSNAFVYFGVNPDVFGHFFTQFGVIVRDVQWNK